VEQTSIMIMKALLMCGTNLCIVWNRFCRQVGWSINKHCNMEVLFMTLTARAGTIQ